MSKKDSLYSDKTKSDLIDVTDNMTALEQRQVDYYSCMPGFIKECMGNCQTCETAIPAVHSEGSYGLFPATHLLFSVCIE